MILRCSIVAALLVFLPFSAIATEDDFFDVIEDPIKMSDETEKSSFRLNGEFDFRHHYALNGQNGDLPFHRQGRGTSSLRTDFLLKARYQLSDDLKIQLSGIASYDKEVIDDRSDFLVDESFVEWGVNDSLNLKIGRQVVAFGESNYFRLADRINPVDDRVWGLAELDDSRLPIAAMRASYYKARWGLDFVTIHEFRENYIDEAYGDFDPFIQLRQLALPLNKSEPDVGTNIFDWSARVFFTQEWGDFALFYSDLHARQAVPQLIKDGRIELVYPDLAIAGGATNYVFGNWLFKAEYSYTKGERFVLSSDVIFQDVATYAEQEFSVERFAEQLMLGGRYSGINNLTLDIELLQGKVEGGRQELMQGKNQLQGLINIDYEMWNDALLVNFLWAFWLDEPAHMLRGRLDYALLDNLVVYGGAITYSANSEGSMLEPYEKNDRLFFGAALSF